MISLRSTFHMLKLHMARALILIFAIGLLIWLALSMIYGRLNRSINDMTARPNIIWIMAEDMGPDLGVYGTAGVKTPVIDRLALSGMVYDKVFMTAPICSTSRSALYTSMYQTSIGAHQHRTRPQEKRSLPDGVSLLTDHFRRAGYFTALIKDVIHDERVNTWLDARTKKDWNFHYDGSPYDGDSLYELKFHQPFFAHIQFGESHRGSGWLGLKDKLDNPADPDRVEIPPYYPDMPLVRQDWANYLNAVMTFDMKLGIVLRRLEEEGLSENTIIMMFSDHGRAMVRGKQWLYDSGLQVPLIISVPDTVLLPKGFVKGGRSNQLVSGIDISATSLNLAGIKPETPLQGKPFLGENSVQRDFVFAARDRADETYDYIRSVRNDKFLYIKNFDPQRPYTQFNAYKETMYPVYRLMFRLYDEGKLGPIASQFFAPQKPNEELYDVEADPYNVRNLAADPIYLDVLVDMRRRLSHWQIETSDQGRNREDPIISAAIHKKHLDARQSMIETIERREGPWRAAGIPKP